MHLLAAPMLFGLALASVPIIIHLLNRRRYQVVEWAPMKYLKLTLKTNRKRMRIEQLLLLLVRVMVIVLLIVALARPSMSRAGLGGFLAKRARISRVIVIDDSLSMGYTPQRGSAFDAARDAAAQIIRGIGAQDSVSVLLTSRPDMPLVRETSLQDSSKLLGQISSIRPADSAGDWPAVFKRVDDLLKSTAHPQKELVILTDLRRAGWSAGVAEPAKRWSEQSVDVKIIDVGSRQTENTVLARLEQEDALALPGAPVKLKATVRNDTPAVIRGAQATLQIDEQSRPLVLPDLPSAASTEVPITITLNKPGQHLVRLALPNDALAADNTRWLAITARPEIKVAMLDGQISNRPFESSTDFLQIAFTAGSDPWQVTRNSETEWQGSVGAGAALGAADVIVIANVSSLSPSQCADLEKLVSAGTGLIIFPGDQFDPQLYNQRLYRDGQGLLPGKIQRIIDEPPNGLVTEGFSDSPLAPLAKIAPEALTRIRPKRFLDVSMLRNEQTRVLARWNDADGHPAVIERRFGRGRVLLWTVSANRQWSDWPTDPTYVLATRTAALSIARPDPAGDNFTAGQEVVYALSAGQIARNPMLTTPAEGAFPQAMNIDGQTLRYPVTTQAGRYMLNWRDARDAEQTHIVAASFDSTESNLQPIDQEELVRLLSPLQPQIIHWTGGGEPVTEAGREIWRSMIAAVLALAAVESMLAMWVGREK